MAHQSSIKRRLSRLEAPSRNNYFYGKLLSEHEFRKEQFYFNNKRWLLNRLGLGEGVLCGLEVEARQGMLCLSPGVALDALGREIIVPEAVCFDPWQITDECGELARELSRDVAHTIYLCLAYRECETDFVPTLVTECNTGESTAASTIMETYSLTVREGSADRPAGLDPELCLALSGQAGEDGSSETGPYQVIALHPVEGAPFAAASGAGRALVVSRSRLIYVLDTASAGIIQEIEDLPADPNAVAIAPSGGPAFVTQEKGISSVDLEVDPPKISASFLQETGFGACAAIEGGKTVFAIDRREPRVVQIDVANQAIVAEIKTGSGPSGLAVSPDEAWLFVTDVLENTLTRIKLADNSVDYQTAAGGGVNAMAVRDTPGGPAAYLGANGTVRVFYFDGSQSDHPVAADPRQAAFTTGGERLYLASSNSDTGENDLVILDTESMAEVARVPLGTGLRSAAVVPGRLRAVTASAQAGQIAVVDLPETDRRSLLCRSLSGACPEPDDQTCVVLAEVELLPDGTIGEIEACAVRQIVVSNAMLLELILCLFDRLEACCAAGPAPEPTPEPTPSPTPEPTPEPTPSPTPTPTPGPTPPPHVPLKVRGIEFRNFNNQVVHRMEHPEEVPELKVSLDIRIIRVIFNKPVDHGTIIAGGFNEDPQTFSFLVQADWSNETDGYVPGEVFPESAQVSRFQIHEEFRVFHRGEYRLTLFADPDPRGLRPEIRAMDGAGLDGEPSGFPSGDGVEGGDFVIKFIIN
jgi:DNA-binding beta-propeller fold protein YncE